MKTKRQRVGNIIVCVFFEILTIVLYFLSFNSNPESFRWICIIPIFILFFISCCFGGFKSIGDFFAGLVGSWVISCIAGLLIAFIFKNPTGRLITTIIISVILGIIVLIESIKLIRKDYIY